MYHTAQGYSSKEDPDYDEYTENLRQQVDHLAELYKHLVCPHCGKRLSDGKKPN